MEYTGKIKIYVKSCGHFMIYFLLYYPSVFKTFRKVWNIVLRSLHAKGGYVTYIDI